MKILHIINSLATGGAEKLLLETLPLYQKNGIQADILLLNDYDTPFLSELKEINCSTIYTAGKRSVYHPINIFKIIPFLKKYDIAHVHLFPAQYYVVIAKIISFSKIKLIFTEHSTSNKRMENKWFHYFDRKVYSLYHTIVCITPEVKNALTAHLRSKKNNIQVISNGVNINKIKKEIPYAKGEFIEGTIISDRLLIQVAAFRFEKDQQTLIKALQFLPENVKLLLVGDGILRRDCEDLALRLNLQKRVVFLGNRMDIPRLLKTADIAVLSSHFEGFGLVAVEGMAAGKPFVASDVPGLAAVVDGAGILFEKGNALDLADKIAGLLADKAYYESVASACQQRAAEYNIDKMVDQHIKLYQSVN